jgi:hypothetical protein
MDLPEEMLSLRNTYSGYACFSVLFDLSVLSRNANQQSKGFFRADKKNERMHMIFRDPMFGIELSRVLIANERVVVLNPQDDSRATVPVGLFEVRGLGNNSVRMPFLLFQNFLYGTLPEHFYRIGEITERGDNWVGVTYEYGGAEYSYVFELGRLKRFSYREPLKKSTIEVSLEGVYDGTIFPKKIVMLSGTGEKLNRATAERMTVQFWKLNTADACEDRHFARP